MSRGSLLNLRPARSAELQGQKPGDKKAAEPSLVTTSLHLSIHTIILVLFCKNQILNDFQLPPLHHSQTYSHSRWVQDNIGMPSTSSCSSPLPESTSPSPILATTLPDRSNKTALGRPRFLSVPKKISLTTASPSLYFKMSMLSRPSSLLFLTLKPPLRSWRMKKLSLWGRRWRQL